MIFFSCSDVVLPFCDQRKPSLVFLISTFIFHVRIVFDIFCLDAVVEQQKKTEEYYSHQLTYKPPDGKEHFTWYYSLSRCSDWKTISHTALPLTPRVSQIFLPFKTVSLTVLASPLFWFKWSRCHAEKTVPDCIDTEFNCCCCCCCCVSCRLCVICLWEIYIIYNLDITDISSLGINNHSCEVEQAWLINICHYDPSFDCFVVLWIALLPLLPFCSAFFPLCFYV